MLSQALLMSVGRKKETMKKKQNVEYTLKNKEFFEHEALFVLE